MDSVGFLKFALKCFFDFIAWPLFSLGFPLRASIRAIENNSTSDMRNLVAYWILFSLISLFELAFVQLIQWIPLWCYMKLMAVCWLVLPHYNGAGYVYDNVLHPWFSVNLQIVIKHLIKPPKEDQPLNAESFLAVAEKYVRENGYEALEKLIDTKLQPKYTKPNTDLDMEDIKTVASMEVNKANRVIQQEFGGLNVSKNNAKAEEPKEKDVPAATEQVQFHEANIPQNKKKIVAATWKIKEKKVAAASVENKAADQLPVSEKIQKENGGCPPVIRPELGVPNVSKNNAKAEEPKEKSRPAATEQVKFADANIAQKEKKIVAAVGEIKENKVLVASGVENKAAEVPVSEKIQKEWACALCHVTTTTEKDLNIHLQGRKHKVQCQQLEASKQATENKSCSSSTANHQDPQMYVSGEKLNQNKTKKQVHQVQVNQNDEQCNQREVKQAGSGLNQSKYWCSICNVACPAEKHMADHLKGKKHSSRVHRIMIDSLVEGSWGY